MINEMVKKMVNDAAKEIGYKESEKNLEEVLVILKNNYETEFDYSTPITKKIMSKVRDAISEWKEKERRKLQYQ